MIFLLVVSISIDAESTCVTYKNTSTIALLTLLTLLPQELEAVHDLHCATETFSAFELSLAVFGLQNAGIHVTIGRMSQKTNQNYPFWPYVLHA